MPSCLIEVVNRGTIDFVKSKLSFPLAIYYWRAISHLMELIASFSDSQTSTHNLYSQKVSTDNNNILSLEGF